MTRSTWKAQLQGGQQLLTAEQGNRVTMPTVVFSEEQGPRFTTPHDDPLLAEMKVASAIVWRIPIDTESSPERRIKWENQNLRGPKRQGLHHGHYLQQPQLRRLHGQGLRLRRPEAPFDGGRRMELHQLGILTLGSGLGAILYVLDVPRLARAPERTLSSNHTPGDNLAPRPWTASRPRLLLGNTPPSADTPGPSA
ncbi:hypothetical protein Cgig2_028197 [Carnegiea gigantea]|uniref:Uncharacterized protein n=1 Tax=Carnegiea gigantea TaxID=171969 RepID=A0A9Q1Q4I6_9CARY|nr:hypothetical protein Cgig2_028197 [Carnegiea gigantea]